MNEELKVLLMIANNLDQVNIPYVISGSMALNYYTIPRMTRDIDIVVELRRGDVDRFTQVFEAEFLIDAEVIRNEVARRGMFNLIHKEYVIKADFILRKETGFQESVFKRRKEVVIEEKSVWMISPEDLVLAKLLWAKDSLSQVQLNDVWHLVKTVENLDNSYIMQWIHALELTEVYEKIKT